jgi:hypothetical protein
MIFAYSLGKAQRLLSGLNTSIGPIFCHGAVERMNKLSALPETTYTGQLFPTPPGTVHYDQLADHFPDVVVSSAQSMDDKMSKPQDVIRVARACSLIIAVTFVAFTSGCGSSIDGAGPGHRTQALALTPYGELELGRRAFAEVLRFVPTVNGGPDIDRVARIGNRIARAAVAFWQEMELIGTRRAQLPEFLSDHPADQRRLDQLRGWLPRIGPWTSILVANLIY